MLTLKFIHENKQQITERLKVKNFDASEIIEQITELDVERKSTQKQLDSNLAESKTISKKIGQLFKEKKIDAANKAKLRTSELKENTKELNQKLNDIQNRLQELLVQIPNIPHDSVPEGKTEEDNELIREGGTSRELPTGAIPHWDLIKKYDIIDFELGNKITGSGFPVYKGKGAKLQRALINFFLDEAQQAGFDEVIPPLLVNEASGFATGQLPDKEGQMYELHEDNYYLIPTAEVPVTNIYRDVILNTDDLPVKKTAYTPCFRREAGAWGSNVRGLNRLHQFDKVEIVVIEHPERSYRMLDTMLIHVENIIKKLELPYRIVRLCGGDISFTSALTFDFEVYAAAQKRWLEVSSVSNFEAYQANRLKLRFKEKGSKGATTYAHTLNGSALALPRIVAALLENNQTENGIQLPKILHKYTGFKIID